MAKKSNIRSIRFSDEMIEMIESQAGRTFTAKFEALVTRCMWELPRKEQELKGIQERIDYERKQLARIQKRVRQMDQNILAAEIAVRNYSYSIKSTIKRLEDITNEL